MKTWTIIGTAGFLFFAVLAAQARVTNLTTMTGYDTIQGAVDAASAGDVIEVYAGTYDETVSIGTALSGLTLRARAGEQVVVSPAAADRAIDVVADDAVVQGFEITGRGIAEGIRLATRSRMQALDNVVHNLRTNDFVYGINLHYAVDAKVLRNRIEDVNSPGISHSVGIRANYGRSHVIASNFVAGLSEWQSGIQAASFSRVFDNEVTDFRGTYSSGIAGAVGGSTNAMVYSNLIHHRGSRITGSVGMRMDYSTGTDWIIHNNRISGLDSGGIWNSARHGGAGLSCLRVVYSHNVIDAHTLGYGPALWINSQNSNTNDGTIVDNLGLARVNHSSGAALRIATTQTARVSLHSRDNVFLAAYTQVPVVNNLAEGNTFDGNFYASNTYVAAAAPFAIEPVPGTDANARGGSWAYVTVPSNTSSTVVGNLSDTNGLGHYSRLVFNTAAGRQDVEDEWGVAFAHVRANWRETNNVPAGYVNLGHTLRFVHRFRDGEVLATVILAYDNGPQYGEYGADAASADLYRWNVRDYANQHWELAVLGNVTNSYFPSNDVRRIVGPPTAELGNYGVEPDKNIVWANINYLGETAAFARPYVPPGTVILIR